MEIIVKIPDDMIKSLEQGSFGAKYNIYDLVGYLMNGTPLSKTIDSLKELSKDHRHNFVGNSCEERAWQLGIEDSIDLILAESE